MSKYRFLATREFEFIVVAPTLKEAQEAAEQEAEKGFPGWFLDYDKWEVVLLGPAAETEPPDMNVE